MGIIASVGVCEQRGRAGAGGMPMSWNISAVSMQTWAVCYEQNVDILWLWHNRIGRSVALTRSFPGDMWARGNRGCPHRM